MRRLTSTASSATDGPVENMQETLSEEDERHPEMEETKAAKKSSCLMWMDESTQEAVHVGADGEEERLALKQGKTSDSGFGLSFSGQVHLQLRSACSGSPS